MPSYDAACVRLTKVEIDNIIKVFRTEIRRPDSILDEVALFGSRTDLTSTGGDIDLFCRFHSKKKVDLYKLRSHLRLKLCELLGDQKFDIVLVNESDRSASVEAFIEVIKKKKVTLWKKK